MCLILIGIAVVTGATYHYLNEAGTKEAATKSPIIIGFFAPLSGNGAIWGSEYQKGVTLGAEEWNLGQARQVRIVIEDSKCDGASAVTAVSKILDSDSPDILIGGACSSEALAVARISEQRMVLLLSPSAKHPGITRAGNLTFRLAPMETSAYESIASILHSKGAGTVGILYETTDMASGLKDQFLTMLEKEGLNATSEGIPAGDQDARSQLTKMIGVEAIAIFTQTPQTLEQILKQLSELGFTGVIVAGEQFGDPRFSESKYPFSIVYYPVIDFKNSSIGYNRFAQKFEERWGRAPAYPFWTANWYESVFLGAEAVKACHQDPACQTKYLTNISERDSAAGLITISPGREGIGSYRILNRTFS